MMRIFSGSLLTSDKQKISYKHYKRGFGTVIIIAHGFFNSKDAVLLMQLKDALIDCYDVIMFDFRGHGKSSGLFSWGSKEGLDLEEILNYARKQYSKIDLVGFSLGAAISISVLAKKDIVDSFVAISTPTEFEKIDYRFWNLDLKNDIFYNLSKGRVGKGVHPGPFWLKKPKPIDLVDKIKCPILYIHGDKDWVIGYKHSQKLYEKTKSKKDIKIIKSGLHAEYLFRKNPQEAIKLIKHWFESKIRGGKKSNNA